MLESKGWKNFLASLDAWRQRDIRHLTYNNQSDLERGQSQGSVHWINFCFSLKP